MVRAARAALLLVGGGLLLSGCASISPARIPHYAYLGTYGAGIATADGGLESEEQLLDEMAKGVGYWTAFRGIEHLIADACRCELRWFERLALWLLPIAINVRRTIHNLRQ